MSTEPSIDDMLRRAFDRVDDDDVALFYAYLSELKQHVRRHLNRNVRSFPGESGIAQSALFSFFRDAAEQNVPLQDVDEDGYPMLWPLLLKYLERHCEKWKKYFRAKKRSGIVVSADSAGIDGATFDMVDHRTPAPDEESIESALVALSARMTERQRQIANLTAAGRTLEQIATEVGCSESLVSLEKKSIRRLIETT